MGTVKYHMPGMHTVKLQEDVSLLMKTSPAPINYQELPAAVSIDHADPSEAMYLDERQLSNLSKENELAEFMNDPKNTTIRQPRGGQLFLFDTRGTNGGIPQHVLHNGYSWAKLSKKKPYRYYNLYLFNTRLPKNNSRKDLQRQVYHSKT